MALQAQEINEIIKTVIFETTNIPPAEILDDASFVDDMQLDSLTLLEIAVSIDQRFRLGLPEEELKAFTSVGVAVDLIMERLGDAAEQAG